MRERYIVDSKTGELIPRNEAAAIKSGRAGPFIRRDAMEPMQSMCDGKTYDSKSAYEHSLRELNARDGGDRQIVGNDYHHLMQPARFEPRNAERDIARALERFS